ncbi:hypothetical protein SUGI_0130250 [Cryptomeria japonica]|uniref:17.4 kDa class III heat shock protein n=1 Tax=Cryptomeria japonica TaxID=3369 RepID=UPI002408C951|nr:17.4 kDa class III heat shock protein [Cryptomeria japonica]XP_057867675.1 17.4 kDa class III heat shock protein [Cryptomeria japonica]XP_057867677.1 17.4 kDa class III heat shock protein [Cryptomeria japonica]GLJ10549.1 hypothetical protein SUGI_0130250 [Cryptomeria japonica]
MEDCYEASFNHLFNFPEDEVLEKLLNSRSYERLLNPRSYEYGKGMASAPVDIKQTPKDYTFLVDVPGLTKSDIQVQVENGKLLVIKCAGKRKRDDEGEEECKLLRVERKVNHRFTRKFTLPGDAKADGISATCVDGVLSVTVPRIVPEKPKTIEISVA